MNSNGPLTLEQAGDPVEVKERLTDIFDRFFVYIEPHQEVAVRQAIEYEILRPLMDRIRTLEK